MKTNLSKVITKIKIKMCNDGVSAVAYVACYYYDYYYYYILILPTNITSLYKKSE